MEKNISISWQINLITSTILYLCVYRLWKNCRVIFWTIDGEDNFLDSSNLGVRRAKDSILAFTSQEEKDVQSNIIILIRFLPEVQRMKSKGPRFLIKSEEEKKVQGSASQRWSAGVIDWRTLSGEWGAFGKGEVPPHPLWVCGKAHK